MANYSKKSLNKLLTCHKDLVTIMIEVIKYIDITIICGHRSQQEQDEAYYNGNSQVRYPNSKHNSIPSHAVDIITYPIVWEDKYQHYFVAGYIKGLADRLYKEGKITHNVRLGADWGQNYVVSDENFFDVYHIELIT